VFGQTEAVPPAVGLDGALPPGVTARFDLFDFARREIAVNVCQLPASQVTKKGGIEVGLLVSGGTELPGHSELAVMDLSGQEQCFVLLIPIELNVPGISGVAVLVRTTAGSNDAQHAAALAKAMEDVQENLRMVAERPRVVPFDPPDWPGLSSALESLKWADRQRAGLNFLAQQTGARLTQDVVLTADPSVLSQLAAAVTDAMKKSPQARDRKSVGWVLEWTTLQLMMRIENGGKLPPELAAVLTMYAGEAGRDPATLEQVMRDVQGWQDLKNRLAEENLDFLEDSSPSARVRAYDWLAARGLAPKGYDPMGSPKDRRQALDAAQQSQQPAGQSNSS